MARLSPPGKLLIQVVFDLVQLRPLMDAALSSVASGEDQDSGLTAASFQVASALGSDQATVPQLAERMGRRRQSVQAAVDDLITAGYAMKVPNPRRTRSPFIELTADGHEVFWDAAKRQMAWVNRKARAFTVDELQMAADVLERFMDQLRLELKR